VSVDVETIFGKAVSTNNNFI